MNWFWLDLGSISGATAQGSDEILEKPIYTAQINTYREGFTFTTKKNQNLCGERMHEGKEKKKEGKVNQKRMKTIFFSYANFAFIY